MNKKEMISEIRDILNANILVDGKTKQKLLNGIDGNKYRQDQLEVMYAFLKNAKINQRTLFYQALNNDPKFEAKVEKAVAHGEDAGALNLLLKQVSLAKKEETENNQEAQELSSLEQELNQI